jgi:hypothetical protein
MPDTYTTIYPWQVLTRVAGLMLSYRLPLAFDPHRLREDTTCVLKHFGTARHFRQDHHDGGWSAIGLISKAGDHRDLRANSRSSYQKTDAMVHAPYIEEVLDGLPCEKHRVRLMRLAAGAHIFWHFDGREHMDGQLARLHVPVVTNPGVILQISHETMNWKAGEFWYGDFSFPHRLHNSGVGDRIHLVMDLVINDFLRKTIPTPMVRQADRRRRMRPWAQSLCRRYTKYAPYMPNPLRAGIGRSEAAEETARAEINRW